MSYINKPLGNVSAMEFSIGGISQVALIEKAKISGITYDATSTLDISGITLSATTKFQAVTFIKGSAALEQEQVKTNTSHYINQKVKFSVLTDDNAVSQSVLLGREYVALIKKNNGKWVLAGVSNGLSCETYTNNSTTDDASRTYELTGANLGDAANVKMSDSAIEALINRV